MPIAPTAILQAEIQVSGIVTAGGSNTRKALQVYHYRRTSTVVTPTKAALSTIFISNMIPLIRACLNARYTGVGVSVRWLNDALDQATLFSSTGVGLVSGDSMPTTEAAFILFQTGLRGKSYRGSKHIFPMSESATTTGTDDIWNAGALVYLGALAAGALASLPDATPNNWIPCVLSRKKSQLRTNPTTVETNDVSSVLVNKRVGTMRHRKVLSTY
jgi:hypothetical protein